MSIRRPPSYSDSYLILNDGAGPTPTPLLLQGSETPRPTIEFVKEEILGGGTRETRGGGNGSIADAAQESWAKWCIKRLLMLGVKGSVHITLISIFETVFFFLYVSRSENQGILKTLDVYYTPLLSECSSWSSPFRTELLELLEFLGAANQTVVDAAGRAAAAQRNAENLQLLWISLGYTGGCIGIGVFCILTLVWSKRVVKWRELVGEHIFFVFVLGLYEWFFFRTIIYNYNTLSTPELNQYLADGLYGCLERSGPAPG